MAELRRYQGICDSLDKPPRGSVLAYFIGVGGACGLNNLFNIVAGNDLTQKGLLVGLAAGLGCILATEAHGRMNKFLSKRNVGLTRGSRLVKQVQGVAFGIPVAAALAFNAASDDDLFAKVNGFSPPVSDVHDPVHLVQSEPVPSPIQYQLS